MKQVYAPGCGLMIYQPELAKKTLNFLNRTRGPVQAHPICCKHNPRLEKDTLIINTCSGCDKRFRTLYEGITTVSLWEILAESTTFPFPDYKGLEMSIQDACPTRSEKRVHRAIRKLLKKMHIQIIEPENTGTKSLCCGDSFYGKIPVDHVKEKMKKRARNMPCDYVVVYCISCIKSMYIGGKKPRHILDLLFNMPTTIGTYEPDAWHKELNQYIEAH